MTACLALAAYRYALLDDILGEALLSLLPILLAFAAVRREQYDSI